MDVLKSVSGFLLTLAMTAALLGCGSQASDKHSRTVGGCTADTTRLGLRLERPRPQGAKVFRVSIRSVRDAGEETYKAAAEDLTALLDSLGIDVFSRTDLVHISKGACWPPYSIGFVLGEGGASEAERLYSSLKNRPVAGLLPVEERPEGYGSFFITASSGSSDLWTLWYGSAK